LGIARRWLAPYSFLATHRDVPGGPAIPDLMKDTPIIEA
jgi:hypothetical protein